MMGPIIHLCWDVQCMLGLDIHVHVCCHNYMYLVKFVILKEMFTFELLSYKMTEL